MSSSAGKRSQSSTSGHGWPWQARTGAQLSLTATHRLRHGWMKLKGDGTKGHRLKSKQQKKGFTGLWKNLRVETDGSNEGAEEGLGLRVAACLQQGPPVLRAWDHLTFQTAVTQKIRQPHLGVAHISADPHLVGDGHAAGGLAHVEGQQGGRQSQESGEEQSHGSTKKIHKSTGWRS